MQPEASPTGWFDDVAMAAASGYEIVIAVCEDLNDRDELAEWLVSAIPALKLREIDTIETSASELLRVVTEHEASQRCVTFVVADASEGDEETLTSRWAEWNKQRELLRDRLKAVDAPASVALLVTTSRMPEIVSIAPDLLSVAHVITVMSDPFAVDPADEELIRELELVQADLEGTYGMSTDEFVERVLARDLPTIPTEDVSRWRALAGILRNVSESQ
jgi:hypothetical protein